MAASARVLLARSVVPIGGIAVRDDPAAIFPDSKLPIALFGMSFLKILSHFRDGHRAAWPQAVRACGNCPMCASFVCRGWPTSRSGRRPARPRSGPPAPSPAPMKPSQGETARESTRLSLDWMEASVSSKIGVPKAGRSGRRFTCGPQLCHGSGVPQHAQGSAATADQRVAAGPENICEGIATANATQKVPAAANYCIVPMRRDCDRSTPAVIMTGPRP
jgi:hypothetical protein